MSPLFEQLGPDFYGKVYFADWFFACVSVESQAFKNQLLRLENENVHFIHTEKYEEDIERLLIERTGDSEKEVCYELTKACDGVDRTKKEKEDVDVRINDQKQEVKTGKTLKQDDDGIHRMNVDINDPGAAARLAEQIKQQIGQGAMGGGGYDGDDDDDDDEDEDDSDDDEKEETQSSKKKTEL